MAGISKIFLLFVVLLVVLPVISNGQESDRGIAEVEKLPLWEYGAVAFATSMPAYRGSNEYTTYAFPVPYFIYRGKVVKASRDGLRGIFWRNKRFETDISLSGNPPVSDDNKARAGMEELDGIVEIGPALRYYLYEAGERDSIYIQGNLRAAFSLGYSDGLESDYQGFISDISLKYRDSRTFRDMNIRYHFSTGIQFSDEELHSYFYEVTPQYATDTRSSYDVGGGYGGWYLSTSLVKKFNENFSISCYGRWINIGGAVYNDSPLVQTNNNYIIGATVIWKIGESETLERSDRTLIERKKI